MKFNKNIDTIRNELFSHIEQVQSDYVKKGWLPNRINLNNGIVRGLLEIFIYGIYQLYSFIDNIMNQAVPVSASGEFLDMHAESVGLTRKPATKARGYVEFVRDGSNTQNIKIEVNKIVRTKPDSLGKIYRYIVIEETVMQKDSLSCLVLVESEDYGIKANATAGAICELVTPIAGIAYVNNKADWLIYEASDKETDSELLERYKYAWQALAGVTVEAYKSAALSVTGVKSVYINDQHPRGQGTIDVYILGSNGLPTENLINEVSKKIASQIIINDDVLVLSPKSKNISVDIEIELLSGNADEIKAVAENAVREYFAGISIGEDVIADKFISKFINLSGVKRINRKEFADITIASSEIAVLENINISTVFVREI